ncbi:hypothetical protein Q8A67_004570 [Cirrhinus molitorella]|uniref:Uncharacterized protein n=1 Tax=Cirrhinus molitorella TaxID=172907 RepID=A0AA88TWK3_9TELE|nr:hypothetical protein Q8A67_004570 [Cirrhinus molitorella]
MCADFAAVKRSFRYASRVTRPADPHSGDRLRKCAHEIQHCNSHYCTDYSSQRCIVISVPKELISDRHLCGCICVFRLSRWLTLFTNVFPMHQVF